MYTIDSDLCIDCRRSGICKYHNTKEKKSIFSNPQIDLSFASNNSDDKVTQDKKSVPININAEKENTKGKISSTKQYLEVSTILIVIIFIFDTFKSIVSTHIIHFIVKVSVCSFILHLYCKYR